FVLSDLQIRRILRAFDEIAGGVEHEQPRSFPLDLAAQQERDVEFHVRSLERLALDVVKLTDDVADALRRLKHPAGIHQRFSLSGLRILPALAQDADRRLTDEEVAAGYDRPHA